ncbi:SDR family oxidoreductase [Candidatus Woesearchaeota archaeon]|nr:SDR family oxidoreductase [Candidatus Woesearchaeota archaeon]
MEEQLKGRKVVVTGGAGFIGSHIVDKLVSFGAEVTVIDNLYGGKIENIAHVKDKIKFIKGDILDLDLLKKEFKDADFVSHQAARRSVPESVEDPDPYNEVNVVGHLRVLQAARDCNVKRVTFASSSSVYGDTDKFPQQETDYPMPISPYAITKLTGEAYNKMFFELYGLEAVNLRYFNVFGPRQDPSSQYACVIPKFILAVLNNQEPTIYWDGEQTRDFTYVENNANANLLAFLSKQKVGGEVINICAGQGITVNEILKQINEHLGKNIKAKFEPRRPGDVRHTKGDSIKAKKLLDYETKINFKEGLIKTIEWFKAHKDRY